MTTVLKIHKDEQELLAQFCAECMISFRAYTVETNDQLLLCEVGTDSKTILFSLGKMLGMAKIHAEWKKL